MERYSKAYKGFSPVKKWVNLGYKGLCWLFLAIVLSSCHHFGIEYPVEHLYRELNDRAEETIKEERSLSLDDCIRIALTNNVHIKVAELERKIARFEKNIAFANFFPQINGEFQIVTFDRTPMTNLGFISFAMQDQTMRIANIQLQMPIFAPATWFLYDLRKKGVEIRNLLYDYTCQMIALQTTVLFFQVLALENIEKSLELQCRSAEELVNQVMAFYEEGMITQSQKEQALLLKQAREHDLAQCRENIRETRAQLNTVLGIFPLTNVNLCRDVEIGTPEGTIEEWIFQVLREHPRILVEEKKVEITEDQIKIAITNFLPLVGGFAQWQYTSNSYMLYSQSVLSGIHSVMTLFNGFANVNEYRIARMQNEKAFIEREEVALSLITGIVRADVNLKKAQQDLLLAQQNLTYQQERCREIEEKWSEGLVAEVDLVSARAELGIAEINCINAKIQEQIARAVLWNAIGKTYMGNSILVFQEAENLKE